MKRRKFLKFLGLSATIPLAVACKPKSRGTFEPYVPEEDPKVCETTESARVSNRD